MNTDGVFDAVHVSDPTREWELFDVDFIQDGFHVTLFVMHDQQPIFKDGHEVRGIIDETVRAHGVVTSTSVTKQDDDTLLRVNVEPWVHVEDFSTEAIKR